MTQQILWAPWRIKYLHQKSKGCLFCKIAKSRKDKQNFLIKRGNYSFSVLNIYPYNNGHAMLSPYRHVSDLNKLNKEEILDLLDNLKELKYTLEGILKPQGFNIGLNLGKVAGAGFPGHLHLHVVPRWNGDTNFMPVISKTKVISESLSELYKKIKDVYKKRNRRV